MHLWIWLAIGGICAGIEILSLNLIFASFSIAAFSAALAQALSANIALPLVVFAVVSVLSLTVFKPFAIRFIFRKTPASDTGILALVGMKAVATSEISDSSGTIMLRSETWTARCDTGVIQARSTVIVTGIDGAIAKVALQTSDLN
jgi:membrane protein implicated in regulation of membrane protease activity